MPPKTISKSNSKKKLRTNNTSIIESQHLDDIINEEIVILTSRQEKNQSSSLSSSKNKATITTATVETLDQEESTDQTQQVTNDLPAKSEVWHYATKLPNGKAKCNSCNREFSCKDHSTSGLRRHLNRCLKISKFVSTGNAVVKKSFNHEMKKKLHELIYQCIIEDSRSFGDLRKPGMTRLLEEIVPGYKSPTRRTVQRQLKRLNNNHTKLLVTELKNVDTLAVTTDLWSDKKLNSYMCLTGHFLNSDKKLASKVLSFTVFPERHTGDEISYTIKKELKRLQVYEKKSIITCDGASNIRKSFDTLQPKRLQCVGHKLHLIVCNALCLWVKEQQTAESLITVDLIYIKIIYT